MPEALRPFQIDGQEQAAQADEWEGDQIAGAGQRVIFLVARQVDEGGDEVRTRGDAAQKEVQNDPPAPLGIGDEKVHA